MRWFRRKQPPETFSPTRVASVEQVCRLILARLEHRAGPPWHGAYGDPFSWLEQVYYTLEDQDSRAVFDEALIALLRQPGARWAALTLVRTLRVRAAVPTLLELAASGELRGQREGQDSDLQLYLLMALDELEAPEAVPVLQALLDDPTYGVSACLALLRIDPELVVARLPDVATASSEAEPGNSGMLGSIGVVLATALRHRDVETFRAMVQALEGCKRPVRLHVADTLRRQTELEVQPALEAEARRRLLRD